MSMEDGRTQQEQQPALTASAAQVTCTSSATSSTVAASDTICSSYQIATTNNTLTPISISSSTATFYYLPQELPPPYPSQENELTVNPVWTSTTAHHHIPITSVSQPSSLTTPPSPPPPYRPVPACYYRPSEILVDSIYRQDTTASPPADYMGFSILNVLCCCRLLGIVAIVKSVQVRLAIENGDMAAAVHNSVSARIWNTASVVSGAVIWSVIIIVIIVIIYY